MAQFKAIKSKGFQMEFANGWTVSVQFGLYNYCENYINHAVEDVYILTCPDAEVAVFKNGSERLFEHPDYQHGDVGQGFTPKQVLDLMIWAESLSPKLTYEDLYKQFGKEHE